VPENLHGRAPSMCFQRAASLPPIRFSSRLEGRFRGCWRGRYPVLLPLINGEVALVMVRFAEGNVVRGPAAATSESKVPS
jgi:hypothetical protein